MTIEAKGTFEIKSWDEKTWEGKSWDEVDGAKLTHARVTTVLRGDIEGEAAAQSLMVYRDDGTASYVGLERVVGRIGSRSGSFVWQSQGTFADGAARTTWTVVPGSGTGDLAGLRGQGSYTAYHGQQPVPFTFDYDFE